jgi:Nucleotidyltransferase/DNA polymerase involved in DNA repair
MIVAFIDFDYFFAQVEEVLNPSLRGKPVVVCVYSGRSESSGAVATCNYEARRLGIRSGMPISSALKLGKDKAVFLPMRKVVYKRFSDEIMNLLRKYADSLEVASIDEAFLDITNRVSNYEQAESLAISMKREILERTQIKTTVGIAPNKVLAKMAAEQAKPNGLKVVSPERVNEFLSQVKLINVPGIGEVIADKLNKLGVRSLNDVLKADPVKMREALGESRYFYCSG